jgi:hypothetical protein
MTLDLPVRAIGFARLALVCVCKIGVEDDPMALWRVASAALLPGPQTAQRRFDVAGRDRLRRRFVTGIGDRRDGRQYIVLLISSVVAAAIALTISWRLFGGRYDEGWRGILAPLIEPPRRDSEYFSDENL